ncbi:hypothetical protein [Streptomyces sp. RerS4]|uniref:hypothetical protein n=1 Tax=Streptomyces sp. RerS4 TaxID=2942449 RepID=UPI00201C08E1|nr:hypothetical protein [Streptomyces sp. RerS4]UQW99524.1 hypothetical protein M4D82_02485 [Streptomyces sp. RerS4]
MKLRHVRAVAVFGIAVIALTGARGSHGASCGGGGSSSSGSGSSGGSSSSSSGGSSDSSSGGTTGSTTGGSDSSASSSGGVSVPGGSGSRNKAERDIKIDSCKMDASGKNLVARLTVTNSGSVDYTYNITMKFRGSATATASANAIPATARVSSLTVKAGASQQTQATTPYLGKGDGSEYKECVVSDASKSAL